MLRNGRRNERGSILVLAALSMVVTLIAASLAIDLGFLAHEIRVDQKVADLAAMDAIRTLPADPTTAAQLSATRNGFPFASSGYSLSVKWGPTSTGPWSSSAASLSAATAVQVSATSPHTNYFPFVAGGQTKTRSAIASTSAYGGFMIGSSLVTIDAARATLLNKFMGGILKGSDLSLSAVSWQGLVAGNVTLDALRTQLVTMGISAGTVTQLLAANLTVNQLLQATANALTAQGGVANLALATQLNSLRATITNTTQITLGQFMHVSQGAENTALESQINVFQLLTGSAELANGSNFIDIPDVGVSVGNVVSTRVRLQVIQPPQFYFGPVGGSVSTSQIDMTVTPKLDLPISVLGLVGAHVKNDLPVRITAAGAVGTLKSAGCTGSSGIVVTVDPSAFSGSASASLDVYATVLFADIPILRVPTTDVTPSTDGGATDLTFNYPTEFPPPAGTETSKHAGSQPIGLNGLTNPVMFTAGPPVVLNGIAAPLVAPIVSALLPALSTVIGSVDTTVLTPLLQALGIDIGSADVTALALNCAVPTLAG
ncbi:MAG: hypothetical protein M3063_08320 [Actinomycetota bacterium]|nr:hypothetical protein [Actinomycetota bacterium]